MENLFDDHALTEITAWFMRRFYKPFRSIFTRSEDYASSLESLGMARSQLVRLRPGFDNEQFHTRFRDPTVWPRLGAGTDTVKVIYCGRVSVEKGLPLLVSVWKKVEKLCAERSVTPELIVVGDGPYRKEMSRELRKRRATFLGFRHGDELSTIYASGDVFVFPSTTDTLGQVVMEAQGSGLPVIVTDEGGPKEVVRDGQTGFVLPASDPGAWVERIVDLACDAAKRRRMGDDAHQFMRGFGLADSFEHFWEVHEAAWRSLLEARGITARSEQRENAAALQPAEA